MFLFVGLTLTLCFAVFFLYCNSLRLVRTQTKVIFQKLKAELKEQGYRERLLVISSKRAKWHNEILRLFGASSKSKHLTGDAIDIMVMDVNNDGRMDGHDVDIVYSILDQKIIRNSGGLGTYKTEFFIWNSQMIHVDSRAKKTRWNR